MKRLNSLRTVVAAIPLVLATLSTTARAQVLTAQNPSDATVIEAINSFNAAMASQDSQIPRNILANAQGIAIIPNTFRGAFVFGVQHGRGVMLTRAANGQWAAPRFVQITGGSFGYQIGVQATDLILVFRSPQSVNNVLRGTLKVGVDASAAAGPYGRQAAAGTDIGLSAEILSYSMSRGAFVGVSIDGSSVSLDPTAEAYYYQPPGTLPASALALIQTIAAYSAVAPIAAPMQAVACAPAVAGAVAGPGAGGWVAAGSRPAGGGETEASRQQLEAASRQLIANLDTPWNQYLALPQQVYFPGQAAPPQDMQYALKKYEDVAANPQFAAVAARPGFQETLTALRKANDVRTASSTAAPLPSPPTSVR